MRDGGPIEEAPPKGHGDSRTSSPDAFARRCGWDPAAKHPLNSHATRGPGAPLRTTHCWCFAWISLGFCMSLRGHSISNPTRSGGVAAHFTHPCRILRTKVKGARGVRISWKLWRVPRRSRYLGNMRPRRLGTSSGSRMRSIQVNGGRCVITFSNTWFAVLMRKRRLRRPCVEPVARPWHDHLFAYIVRIRGVGPRVTFAVT